MNLLLMGETLAHSFLCQSAKGHLIDYFLSTIQNDSKNDYDPTKLDRFPASRNGAPERAFAKRGETMSLPCLGATSPETGVLRATGFDTTPRQRGRMHASDLVKSIASRCMPAGYRMCGVAYPI